MKPVLRKYGAVALLCLPALSLPGGLRLKLDLEPGECGADACSPEAAAGAPVVTARAATPPAPMASAPSIALALPDAPTAASPREMTLAEAVRIAVGRHPAITASTAGVEQQAGGVDTARAGYYPQISAGLNTNAATARIGSNNGTQVASLSLSQMVYDFGKVASKVDQAEASLRRQQALLPRQIDAIALLAGEAAVALHRYQALSRIAEEQVAALGRVLELARLRADAGLSSQADPIQARSRLEAAQVLQQQYGAQQRQARERLRTLLGPQAPERIAAMPATFFDDARVEQAPELGQLPEVLAAEAELSAAVASLRSARAQGMPTVSLEASVNQALAGTISGTDGRHRYGTFGIGISAPLYQGGAQEGAVRSAVAAIDAARAQVELARLNAGDQVRALREQINGVQGRLTPLAQRSRTIAQTRELYQEQYKLGTRSVLDLLSAEQEISQARTDQETAQHDLWSGLVDYVVAAGAARRVFSLDLPPPPVETPALLPPAAERRPEPRPDPAQQPPQPLPPAQGNAWGELLIRLSGAAPAAAASAAPAASASTAPQDAPPLPDDQPPSPASRWQKLLPLGFFK